MSQPAKPITIVVEGLDQGLGYVIKPGALVCLDEIVPVVWGISPAHKRHIGNAGNFRREGNKVVMDVQCFDAYPLDLEDPDLIGSAFVTRPKYHQETNPLTKMFYQVVTYGVVREVQLSEKEKPKDVSSLLLPN